MTIFVVFIQHQTNKQRHNISDQTLMKGTLAAGQLKLLFLNTLQPELRFVIKVIKVD